MLRRAAAAQAMEKVEHHWNARLTAGHGKCVCRFVGHLWPRFVNKTAGAQIDDGLQSGHRCPGREAAKPELGYRRCDHALAVLLFEILKHVAMRAQAEKGSVDQMNALIRRHDFVQRLELGFVVGYLSHVISSARNNFFPLLRAWDKDC